MNYTSFCESLRQSLLSQLAPETAVTLQKIRKNNGIVTDAFCIRTPDTSYSPIVYLSQLYDDFLSGADIRNICQNILACLDQKPPFSAGLLDKIRDFDSARDRVAYRLISKEANEDLLSDIPWVPYLDLAMVFYLYLDAGPDGQTTALIHNQQLGFWNISTDDLYLLSLINTPSLFPPVIRKLEDLLYESGDGAGIWPEEPMPRSPEPDPPLYILTNRPGIHGAACLLYQDIIKDFADRTNSDVLIIPSSIHEVILIPDSHIYNYQEIRDMIRIVNSEDVPAEDRLSDQLYLFSRKKKHLRIWFPDGSKDKPEPAGKWNP